MVFLSDGLAFINRLGQCLEIGCGLSGDIRLVQHLGSVILAIFNRWQVKPVLFSIICEYLRFLDYADTVAASSGLLFINGLGAVSGLLVLGWMIDRFDPSEFVIMIDELLGGLMISAFFWMMQRIYVSPLKTLELMLL